MNTVGSNKLQSNMHPDKEYPFLLTIAIPTYNRLNTLKRSLDSAIIASKGQLVEIIVSDNCSKDGTEEYMRSFVQNHPEISYYRNHENRGLDYNFLQCLEKAQGEYVWILSDDDVVLKSGFDDLILALRLDPVFVHLNSASLHVSSHNDLIYGKPRLQEEGIVEFTDKNAFLEKVGIYITFISALVFKNEYVSQIPDKEKYIGSFFLQSHVALRTMENPGLYIINTTTCCAATSNQTVSYDLMEVWGSSYTDLLYKTAIDSGFDKPTVDRIAYASYKTTILSFVRTFRRSCKNERYWNKKAMYQSVKRWPRLAEVYNRALKEPRFILRVRHLFESIGGSIKRRLHQ